MKKIILILLFSHYAIQIQAQFGEIRGIVTDKISGDVLAGATVIYYVTGNMKGTTTNEKGEYKIKPLIPGIYDIEVSYVTYKAQKISQVAVSAEKTTYINISLVADNNLPVVEITWEPPLVDPGIASTMKVISAEDIKQAVSRDIKSHIAGTAGVYQRDEGGSLNIRGSRNDATLYVVDGIKMDGAFSVPNSAIAEITVITGGIPAQFGDATGGVVLITTKSYRMK